MSFWQNTHRRRVVRKGTASSVRRRLATTAKLLSKSNRPLRTCRYRSPALAGNVVLNMLLAFCILLPCSYAQSGTKEVDEGKLKAVYMYSFGKYTTWPASTFEKTNNEIVIGIYGDSPVLEHVQRVAAKRKLQNRKIRVVYFKSTKDYVPCHMVFVSHDVPESEQRELVSKLSRRPVLLIGETAVFNGNGGMVSFFLTDDMKVKFEIEVQNTRKSGLSLDAKLLKLGAKRPVILPPSPVQSFETSNAPPPLPTLQR